jgi:hypothetical protein
MQATGILDYSVPWKNLAEQSLHDGFMSEHERNPPEAGRAADSSSRRPSGWLIAVRYGIPAAMIIGGFVLAFVGAGDQAIEGCAMAVGGGLSVLLLNTLYRVGVNGEAERAQEDAARAYYTEHGRWPPDPDEAGDGPAR